MHARVGPREGAPHAGWFELEGMRVPCALGAAGISAVKTEGDGATPAGSLPIRRVLFRADRLAPPATVIRPREPIAPGDLWCDDPADPAYNRPVRRPHAGRTEELRRDDGLYDVVAILGWNDAPVVPGRGSAIFLHVASPGHGPTEGCIALTLPDLLRALEAGLTGIDVG